MLKPKTANSLIEKVLKGGNIGELVQESCCVEAVEVRGNDNQDLTIIPDTENEAKQIVEQHMKDLAKALDDKDCKYKINVDDTHANIRFGTSRY